MGIRWALGRDHDGIQSSALREMPEQPMPEYNGGIVSSLPDPMEEEDQGPFLPTVTRIIPTGNIERVGVLLLPAPHKADLTPAISRPRFL